MKWYDATAILVAFAALCCAFALFYALGRMNWDTHQLYFPCAEDEVLGYDQRSTTHVVCIHRDEVK